MVVVSTDARNTHPRANTILVIPLSTSIHKTRPADLYLGSGQTGLRDDCVAQADNICTVRRDQVNEPVQGHRRLMNSQICALAALVRIGMGCID